MREIWKLENASYVSSILKYDASSGEIFWKARSDVGNQWNAKHSGREGFTAIGSGGYKHGLINSRFYAAHRVAWCLHYGEWPDGQIDHINGIRTDNRIENLRVATNTENGRNRASRRGVSSKYKGVCWHKRDKKWMAGIRVNGKRICLGGHKNEESAAQAYNDACLHYFGEYARPNQIRDAMKEDNQ